jgi:RHS repeat-associated protein
LLHYLGNAADTSDLVGPPTRWYTTPENGKEFLTETSDGTTTYRQVQQNYSQRPCGTGEPCWFGNPVTLSTATFLHDPTLSSSQTTEGPVVRSSSFLYDSFNNMTDESDYDWGNSTLLRHTHTDFNTALGNITDLPSETRIYNGSNALMADTQYFYDETSLAPESGITNYDSGIGQTRGNLTTLRQCPNTASCTWLSTITTYDVAGNVMSVKDPNGNTTGYTYADPQNTYAHVTSRTNAMGQTEYWTYDYDTGKPTSATDLNGVQTAYSYLDPSSNVPEPLDRVRVIYRARSTSAETRTNVTYTSPTQVDVYNDQYSAGDKQLHTQTVYDGFGRTLTAKTFTGTNAYISSGGTYDALGRVLTTTSPLGMVTQFACDPLSRTVSSTTLSDNAVVQRAYSGNTLTTTDQAGKKRVTTTDGLGRLTQVTEDPSGLGYTTTYGYDALDDLISVSQSGQSRSFTYDSLKRLTSATNPESGIIQYPSYDGNGNLLSRTDANSVVTNYAYDSLNRLTSKTYPGGGAPNVTYSYCNATSGNCGITYAVGRMLSEATTGGVSTSYSYDPLGRVATSTQTVAGQSFPFSYNWNNAGDLTQETYPSGRAAIFGYDYANQPAYVGGSYGGQSSTYLGFINFAGFHETYRSLGGQGTLVLSHAYNSRDQVGSLTLNNWASPNNALDYTAYTQSYNYGGSNNNGNLLSTSEYNSPGTSAVPYSQLSPAVSTSYSYDGANRLSSVTDASYARTFCYDAFGNGWVTESSGSPGVPGNAPQEIGGACPSGTNPYLSSNRLVGTNYDSAGNQTSFGGNTVGYDAENRTVSVKTSGGAWVDSTQYDGDGKRVAKTTFAGTTTYVYDALGSLAAEYVGGVWSKDYIRFRSAFIPSGNELVAIENAVGNGSACGTCFVVSDVLGSTRLVADATGTIYARHDYLPFGEEAVADGNRLSSAAFGAADATVQRFTGKERDAESGLDYFGARYYGSALGRFTSPDEFKGGFDDLNGQAAFAAGPIPYADISDPQTLNKYVYVRNNPLRYVDPNGHCFWDACIGEGYATAVAVGALATATAAYLASPSGQQAIQATGQLIQTGLTGIQNLVTQATNSNSNQQNAPPPTQGAQTATDQAAPQPQRRSQKQTQCKGRPARRRPRHMQMERQNKHVNMVRTVIQRRTLTEAMTMARETHTHTIGAAQPMEARPLP